MNTKARFILPLSIVLGLAAAQGCGGSDFSSQKTGTGGNGGDASVGGAATGGAHTGGTTGVSGSANGGSAGSTGGTTGAAGATGTAGTIGTAGAVGAGGATGTCASPCQAPTPYCGATNTCVQCRSASDCNPVFTTGCDAGACVCKAGLTPCNGACVDLTTDPNNCGACNKACGSDQVCNGTCTCRPGLTSCNGTCTDTTSDPANCGGCAGAAGSVCAPADQCNGGVCQLATTLCPADSCATTGGAIACVNFQTDPENCGGCGNACGNDEVCAQGNCRRYVPAFGCNACPCSEVCGSLLQGSSCCSATSVVTAPIICVGGGCP